MEILYLCGFDPNDLLQADWPNASGVQQTSINEDRKRGLFQASLPKRPYSVRRGRGRLRRRRQSGLTGDRLPGSTASSCRRPPECLAAPVGILEIDAIGTSSVGKRPRSTASLSRLSNCDRISLFIALWFGRIEVDHAAPAPLRPWVAVNAQIGHPNARQLVGRGCLTVRGLGYRGALTRQARAPAPLCNRSCGLAGCTPRT